MYVSYDGLNLLLFRGDGVITVYGGIGSHTHLGEEEVDNHGICKVKNVEVGDQKL